MRHAAVGIRRYHDFCGIDAEIAMFRDALHKP
jgi:hypothetical protein